MSFGKIHRLCEVCPGEMLRDERGVVQVSTYAAANQMLDSKIASTSVAHLVISPQLIHFPSRHLEVSSIKKAIP